MFCVDIGDSNRLVVDCSKPVVTCVNNFVDKVCSSFSYLGIDALTTNMCVSDFIAVTNIKNAYRSVCIHPSCHSLQGLFWDFGQGVEYFCDNRMSMGLSSSPYIFTHVGNSVAKCATVQQNYQHE